MLKDGLENGKMHQDSINSSWSESSDLINSLTLCKNWSAMKLEKNILSLLHSILSKLIKIQIARLLSSSSWVLVLTLVSKLLLLLKNLDSRPIFQSCLWVRVKDKLLKGRLKMLWMKANGFFCRIVTWLHHLCLNLKGFLKMLKIFIEISESGWLVCLRTCSLWQSWWKESKWPINLLEALKTISWGHLVLSTQQALKNVKKLKSGRKCSWDYHSSMHWFWREESMVLLGGIFPINSQLLILPFARVNWRCSWTNTSKFHTKHSTTWLHRLTMEAGSQTPWTEDWSRSFWRSSIQMRLLMMASSWQKMELTGSWMSQIGMTHWSISKVFHWTIPPKCLVFIPTHRYLQLLLRPTPSAKLSWCCCQEMWEEVVHQLNRSSSRK